MIDMRGQDNINQTGVASPKRKMRDRQKQAEGMYQEEEGKNIDYNDRISDQEEIKVFTDNIFN